jgi:WD repeat-containing protein 35
LISKIEKEDKWTLVLCNAVGCPLESKTIAIEPKHSAMSSTHLIIACDDVVYYWEYRKTGTKSSGVVSLEQQKR